MKKLEKIQQNKLISSYGGVGSIIETNTNGALLIKPYDEWPCFGDRQQMIALNDPRLLQYVRSKGYTHLTQLVSTPTPAFGDGISIYAPNTNDINRTVRAKFFPEWYYCPRCRRLKNLATWRGQWNDQFPRDGHFNDNEPACCHCSVPVGNNGRIHRSKLQQVRFVMADMLTGELKDIPFDKLWDGARQDNTWQLSQNGIEDEIYYKTTENNDGLQGVYLLKAGDRQIIRLSEVYAKYLIEPGEPDGLFPQPSAAYRMEMRGSQSLYLPNIVRSLFIPLNNQDNTPNNQGNIATTEDELDIQEFRYLTDKHNYANSRLVENNCDLVAVRKKFEVLPRFISRITALERLKETSVLLSYTRLAKSNEQRMWYDVNERRERQDMSPVPKKPFNDRALDDLTWMPAVEAYGEGILFELNLKNLNQNDRLIFAHTYCHIVMKELEFQCGYPLTSLKEKIFVDNDNNQAGFLIYTIAGSEGSYGGLISLTDDNRIIKLINRGAERAMHCTNDPICINEGDAHCFACLDLPETSCSKFNNDLNRKLFLDNFFDPQTENITADLAREREEIDPETGIRRGVNLA